MLTGGQASDIKQAEGLLEGHSPEAVIADKAYDSDAFVEEVAGAGAAPCIPSRKNRKGPREIDREMYKSRDLAERFWRKAKQFRRVATRYDRLADSFLAFVQLAAFMISIR